MIGKVTPLRRDVLDMWIVYDHPSDYPEHFVARRWILDKPVPEDFVLADTLGEIQAQLIEVGRIRFMRSETDDPVIVEVWL